jgi:hypothetical protein
MRDISVGSVKPSASAARTISSSSDATIDFRRHSRVGDVEFSDTAELSCSMVWSLKESSGGGRSGGIVIVAEPEEGDAVGSSDLNLGLVGDEGKQRASDCILIEHGGELGGIDDLAEGVDNLESRGGRGNCARDKAALESLKVGDTGLSLDSSTPSSASFLECRRKSIVASLLLLMVLAAEALGLTLPTLMSLIMGHTV